MTTVQVCVFVFHVVNVHFYLLHNKFVELAVTRVEHFPEI